MTTAIQKCIFVYRNKSYMTKQLLLGIIFPAVAVVGILESQLPSRSCFWKNLLFFFICGRVSLFVVIEIQLLLLDFFFICCRVSLEPRQQAIARLQQLLLT